MAPPTLPPIAERVARGARLLDELEPSWTDWMDLAALDVEVSDGCVLAQLHGSYETGLGELLRRRPGLNPAEFGLILYDQETAAGVSVETVQQRYAELTDCWRQEVTRRTTTPAQAADSGVRDGALGQAHRLAR